MNGLICQVKQLKSLAYYGWLQLLITVIKVLVLVQEVRQCGTSNVTGLSVGDLR